MRERPREGKRERVKGTLQQRHPLAERQTLEAAAEELVLGEGGKADGMSSLPSTFELQFREEFDHQTTSVGMVNISSSVV